VARKTAEKFHIPTVFNSLDELISSAEKEATKVIYDIAIPATEIYNILKQLPNDSFALVQKPMGETLEQARQIRHLCKEKNLYIAINFQLRYAPQMLFVKDLLKRGVLGKKLTTL
jgi:predicted dehydrogenase